MLFHNHKRKNLFVFVVLCCLTLLLCGGCSNKMEPVTVEFFAMDTYMTMTAYGSRAAEALDEAEKKGLRVDLRRLSRDLGVHYNTLCRKLRGEMPFTLDEALRVKRLLLTDLPLERLFETPGQEMQP